MKGINPKYDFEIIKDLIKQGKTLKELGELYNVAPSSVGRALTKAGIYYTEKRKITKNHEFFESIDSEIKAYLLGFFVADGCVYNKSRFGICISKTDSYITNLFAKYIAPESFMKETHNKKGAKDRKPQIFLRISSEKIVSDLKKLGIENRKTYKPIKIPNILNELKWAFIRGYCDGDGHIGIRKVKNSTVCRICFSNGDRTILDDIKQFAGFGRIRQQKTHFRLDIERALDVQGFLDNMYRNANFFLQRKFDKYILVNTEVIPNLKRLVHRRA